MLLLLLLMKGRVLEVKVDVAASDSAISKAVCRKVSRARLSRKPQISLPTARRPVL